MHLFTHACSLNLNNNLYFKLAKNKYLYQGSFLYGSQHLVQVLFTPTYDLNPT